MIAANIKNVDDVDFSYGKIRKWRRIHVPKNHFSQVFKCILKTEKRKYT